MDHCFVGHYPGKGPFYPAGGIGAGAANLGLSPGAGCARPITLCGLSIAAGAPACARRRGGIEKMVRGLILVVIVVAAGFGLYGAITLFDDTLQVGRMWETPAVRPHEEPIPFMAAAGVPFDGGERLFRSADPLNLTPSFALDDPAVIAQGRQGYQYYCIQCHGKYHDGLGTVGQSFAPLPGDLRSDRVQSKAPGVLFHEISYGIPDGRQPPLATTIAVDPRWHIIGYIRSLGVRRSIPPAQP